MAVPTQLPPRARSDWTIPQDWGRYTAEEHAVWDTLFARQTGMLEGRVTSAFRRGLDVLRLSRAGIPDFAELSQRLAHDAAAGPVLRRVDVGDIVLGPAVGVDARLLGESGRILVAVEAGPGGCSAEVVAPAPVGPVALEGELPGLSVADGGAFVGDEVGVADVVEVDDHGEGDPGAGRCLGPGRSGGDEIDAGDPHDSESEADDADNPGCFTSTLAHGVVRKWSMTS